MLWERSLKTGYFEEVPAVDLNVCVCAIGGYLMQCMSLLSIVELLFFNLNQSWNLMHLSRRIAHFSILSPETSEDFVSSYGELARVISRSMLQ